MENRAVNELWKHRHVLLLCVSLFNSVCMCVLFFQLCYADGLQDPNGGRPITGQVFLSVRER